MPIPMARLNRLWWEQGNIVVTEEEGTLIACELFIHFPARTPVFDIWNWFEASSEGCVVACKLSG